MQISCAGLFLALVALIASTAAVSINFRNFSATVKPSQQSIQSHLDRLHSGGVKNPPVQQQPQHEITVTLSPITPAPEQGNKVPADAPQIPEDQPKSTLCHITVHKRLRHTWLEAFRACKELGNGTELVSINSEEDYNVLNTKIKEARTHHNHYGTTKKVLESNGSGTQTTTLTLRSNQLARLDESADYEEDNPDEDMGPNNIYSEAATLSATTTTSRTKNRKIKVASSVWSLSSGGRAYRNHPGRLVPEVSLRQLRLIENLGSCLYGQVHLYDFEGEIACHEGTLYRNCRLIAKTIKSVSEIRLLSILDHEHVLEMIGVCNEMKTPRLALFPAPECGDLCSFLSRLSNTPSLSWLLSVGAQIASGMNYLESLSLIHRDLAARNCLVEREGSIRISDLAMACEQYHGDYCHTSCGLAPLRWWSWESILTDEFNMQSSVWSFGVTLWEILTLCRQKPLAHVPDHQIVMLAEKYGSTATSQQVWLPQPVLSPPEIFDLMRECWQKCPDDRPTFQNIHLFLEQKCSNTIYHAV